jgi:hypothetical protein
MANSGLYDRRSRRPFSLTRAVFRYTGRTQSTVAGPVSGRYYRFASPGATVEADPRDAPWLEQLPDLRRV